MTRPKKEACPRCGAPGEELSVYTYENGWRHVECDGCHYMGPGEGNIVQAIRSHNARSRAKTEADAA